MEILEEEIKTYEERKAELLLNEGKFVLIKKSDVKGFFDTYGDAVQAGYERFGLEPFFVKQIEGVERVQFIARG